MPIGNPDQSEKMSVSDGLLFNYMIREKERESYLFETTFFKVFLTNNVLFWIFICFNVQIFCPEIVDQLLTELSVLLWIWYGKGTYSLTPPPPLYTVAFLYTYLSILHRINLSDLLTAAVVPVVMPVEILLVYWRD